MASTRFNSDPCKINIQNQQSTDQGRWVLNTPGNGDKPYFMSDPNIICQKWGGNLWTNAIDVQSELLGMNKRIGKDCLGKDQVRLPSSKPIMYESSSNLTTEQSRAIAPSWTVRDLEQVHFVKPILNPQENIFMPFPNYLNTRVLEKDYYDNRKI